VWAFTLSLLSDVLPPRPFPLRRPVDLRDASQTPPVDDLETPRCGWVQREGGPVEDVRPGDGVWLSTWRESPAQATPTTAMAHIATQQMLDGKVGDWMEHVIYEQYWME
jgi:hypothetical protein